MTALFGAPYADLYDVVYAAKDYPTECDVVEQAAGALGKGPLLHVLDLGCGTGGHALVLARRGYHVVGVDRSEGMLARARGKAAELPTGCRVEFHHADIRHLDLGRQFDVTLMMFSVLGYQLTDADVLSALAAAREHLRPDGLLVFDVWYGPAVLHQRPGPRLRDLPVPGGRVLRASSGTLDVGRHLCAVHVHVRRFEGEHLALETEEDHRVRFFFPLELQRFLRLSEFDDLHLGAFPDFSREPSDETWNVLGVARAGRRCQTGG